MLSSWRAHSRALNYGPIVPQSLFSNALQSITRELLTGL